MPGPFSLAGVNIAAERTGGYNTLMRRTRWTATEIMIAVAVGLLAAVLLALALVPPAGEGPRRAVIANLRALLTSLEMYRSPSSPLR
jgi:hypothetical protein